MKKLLTSITGTKNYFSVFLILSLIISSVLFSGCLKRQRIITATWTFSPALKYQYLVEDAVLKVSIVGDSKHKIQKSFSGDEFSGGDIGNKLFIKKGDKINVEMFANTFTCHNFKCEIFSNGELISTRSFNLGLIVDSATLASSFCSDGIRTSYQLDIQ